jgi:hypothetical protein
MKDEVIQQYLNSSTAAPREMCVLGAPRCPGLGLIVGALGVSKDQLQDALLEGIFALRFLSCITANQSGVQFSD